MGRRVIRGLKARVGRKCSISRGKARLYSGGTGIQAKGDRRGSHSVAGKDAAGRVAPKVRTAKSSVFGEGE